MPPSSYISFNFRIFKNVADTHRQKNEMHLTLGSRRFVEINIAIRRFYSKSATAERWRTLIRTHTEVSTDHMTPEIQLHLITQKCSLWHSRGEDVPFPDPFWAFYWPGGQVLSRYLLLHYLLRVEIKVKYSPLY